MAIFAHFQNGLIFRTLAVSSSRFLQRTTAISCTNVLSMCFYIFFIFDPKWPFCKGYSICLMAFFANFQNAFFFRILAVFSSRFCIEQLQCLLETFLACFFAILIFDPKWPFSKGYSPCLIASFAHFQNVIIFQILAVFPSLFLHRTTAMFCTNVFSMFFWHFKFLTQSDHFAKAIALAWLLILPIFKMLSFFKY